MTVDFNGIGSGQVNTQKTGSGKAQGNTQSSQQADARQAQTTSARDDNVSLSSEARDLKQLEQSLDSYPEMDDQRIEQIRNALADGSYRIDADKLAQKMLDMDNSIFG